MCYRVLTGCSNQDSEKEDKVEIKVLSGFPLDFMPLFEVLRVNNCSYEVKEEANWVFGKDMYLAEFESKASKEELSVYYKDLLDSVDEEASFDEYSFEGLIGEQRVSVNITDEGFQDALGTTVNISFGVPKNKFAKDNKYFGEYPNDLIDQAFVNSAFRYKYLEDNYYKLKQYSIAYQTIEAPEVVVAHYNNLYSGKDKFKTEKDQYGTTFTWVDGEYKCYVRYTDSVSTDMLLLSIQKEL
ncbi:MAG: hypothetical protein FD141_1547 [Fusobacteria bacterium]|nr:MAG: hypothetical protein FD141_1547 [Fusobacteriota bacterium]KAF0230260.1 MAG: hypothetical protein FD182_650 [Fusobacteriota bacterium]